MAPCVLVSLIRIHKNTGCYLLNIFRTRPCAQGFPWLISCPLHNDPRT